MRRLTMTKPAWEVHFARNFRGRATLLWLEYACLIIGLAAINYYVWINVSAAWSQAYESWSFSEQLEGRPVSMWLFVRQQMHKLLGKEKGSGTTARVSPPRATTLTPT